RFHHDVGIGCRRTPFRTGCRGGVRSQLHLASENRVCPLGIHHQQYEVGRLSPDLKSDISPFQCEKSRSAPMAREVLACSTGDGPSTEISANAKGKLQNGGYNDHALGFIQKTLGYAVGYIHNLLKYLAAGGDSLLLAAFACCECRTGQKDADQYGEEFSP